MAFASVSAEVNDVWLVHQQQSLQIDRLDRRVLVQFESVAIWTFMNSFEDLARLFVYENAAGRPWV